MTSLVKLILIMYNVMKKSCFCIILVAMLCCCNTNKQVSLPLAEKIGTGGPDSISPKPSFDVKITDIKPVARPKFP